jgi:hypothetical protein
MGRYSLELELAERLGLSTAAVYDRLYDLCLEKRQEHCDCYDGCYWIRMPSKDFPRVFPYLHPSTVSKALRKLRDEGLIRTVRHGRVCWYTIT